jgi:hypothetical protein
MEELSLDTVCAIFEWPGFLLEAQPFAGAGNIEYSPAGGGVTPLFSRPASAMLAVPFE